MGIQASEAALTTTSNLIASDPQAYGFGREVVAAWITPIAQLHEMHQHPEKSITSLEARIALKNKVVIVSTGSSRDAVVVISGIVCKVYVVYKGKQR
jgi:hypothetical protein